jgi:hypothetical protein
LMERFSAYGLGVDVPDDWRIEFNPKSTREKGDVAFHSPHDNAFFVSWGKLDDAQRRFETLEQQRDESVKRVKGNPNIAVAKVELSSNEMINGHRGVLSKMVTQRRRGGMMSRSQDPPHEVWTAHLHCPQSSRYYVVYWDIRDGEEYPDVEGRFRALVRSFVCHR